MNNKNYKVGFIGTNNFKIISANNEKDAKKTFCNIEKIIYPNSYIKIFRGGINV